MEIGEFTMDFFSLAGKSAIVTGGNTGLGRAFSLALAKAGADVFVPSAMDDDGETGRLIEAAGRRHEFLQIDITAPGAAARVVDACVERSARSTSWSTAPASARSPTCSSSAARSGMPPSPSISPPRSR